MPGQAGSGQLRNGPPKGLGTTPRRHQAPWKQTNVPLAWTVPLLYPTGLCCLGSWEAEPAPYQWEAWRSREGAAPHQVPPALHAPCVLMVGSSPGPTP